MNILPCPFCGKEIFDIVKEDNETTIICDNIDCLATAQATAGNFNSAVDVWNKRKLVKQ